MKRTLLLIAISVIAFKSQAQTEAGKFMLGGGGLYSSTKSNDNYTDGKVLSIIPQAGYFVRNNLAIGTGIGYQLQLIKQTGSIDGNIYSVSKLKTEGFVIAPFARYYKNISAQFRFFGQLSLPMNFNNTKVGDGNGKNYVKQSTNNNYGASLSPGFAFFPGGSKISFEFSVTGINYNHSTYKGALNNDKSSNDQVNIAANLMAPTIGIYFYL